MTTNDDILRRARGILARMGSHNPNEAAVAAEKLEALLAEHNLTLYDVRRSQEENQRSAGARMGHAETQYAQSRYSPLKQWKENLGAAVARFYDLHLHLDFHGYKGEDGDWARNKKGRAHEGGFLVFAGDATTVGIAIDLWNWIVTQLEVQAGVAWANEKAEIPEYMMNRAGHHVDPLKWRAGFFQGAVGEVDRRLRKIKKERDEANRGDKASTALVLVNKKALQEYVDQNWSLNKGKARRRSAGDAAAYAAGVVAGANADLGTGRAVSAGRGRLGPGG